MEEDIGAPTPPEADLVPEADPVPETDTGSELPVTGEPRVDEALRGLGELGDLPVSEHPGVFERIHGQLADVLGELRSGAVDDRRTAS